MKSAIRGIDRLRDRRRPKAWPRRVRSARAGNVLAWLARLEGVLDELGDACNLDCSYVTNDAKAKRSLGTPRFRDAQQRQPPSNNRTDRGVVRPLILLEDSPCPSAIRSVSVAPISFPRQSVTSISTPPLSV